jgi:hypothetical protein
MWQFNVKRTIRICCNFSAVVDILIKLSHYELGFVFSIFIHKDTSVKYSQTDFQIMF